MQTKEEYYGVYTAAEKQALTLRGDVLQLKAKRPVLIGRECLLKVNLSIGVSESRQTADEEKKLQMIVALSYRPDSIMDLSIVKTKKPLWQTALRMFDGAVGTIPYYALYDDKAGIDEQAFFKNVTEMAKGGVSFMTLHPTADLDLYREALKSNRIVPTTSRGGYVLLKDVVINGRKGNLVSENFGKILDICKQYGVAVSIGTVFRPATVWEALDPFHRREIELQKTYIDYAKARGVAVMMEGVGHLPLNLINEYAELIRPLNVPLMPLGPIPSDEIIGFDHVSNVIGASALAQTGVVGMINSVTREEHTGKVPSVESVLEGLKAARTAAHCYNVAQFPTYKKMTEVIGVTRAKHASCVQQGGIFACTDVDRSEMENCTRCRHECPLKKIIE